MAQMVKKGKKKICLPMQETRVGFLVQEDPKRKWKPIPIFLPGKSHGQRSLAVYSPLDCKESDTTEHICMAWHPSQINIKPHTKDLFR